MEIRDSQKEEKKFDEFKKEYWMHLYFYIYCKLEIFRKNLFEAFLFNFFLTGGFFFLFVEIFFRVKKWNPRYRFSVDCIILSTEFHIFSYLLHPFMLKTEYEKNLKLVLMLDILICLFYNFNWKTHELMNLFSIL